MCIPVYNGGKYIENILLSIINQSFESFEIIIVNDFSSDDTFSKLIKYNSLDKRIKILNNKKNSGVYYSRATAVLFSRGQYISFIDPDDMILNKNLFLKLYYYNLGKNLDIIEFLVYHKNEWRKDIYNPTKILFSHKHNYRKKIIYQPELRNMIHFENKTISKIICRTVWNKIFSRRIQLKSIKYIGYAYYYTNLIYTDDTMVNLINFNFANNYSIITIPGYLYINKRISSSIGYLGKQNRIKQNINLYYFFELLFKSIKDFDKNINYIFPEIILFEERIIEFKTLNISVYSSKLQSILKKINKDKKSSSELKNITSYLLFKLKL